MVHISGQVYKPGLVELESGSRVVDAVNKAGGLKEDADLDRINLAKKLADEEKIYVPKVGENTDNVSDISIAEGSDIGDNTDGKIDINNATKEELISLPGIGEVIADRIIDYRKNNRFKTIEDIKNVSGIGSKKYEGIKDLIKVN
jgi:competence protein ComEA